MTVHSLPPSRFWERPSWPFGKTLLLSVCLSASLLSGVFSAELPVVWQVGDDYWRQLDQPFGVEWAGNPLRQALGNLARAQRICIWLDRRVDPDRKPTFRVDRKPLREGLEQLAREMNCGIGFMDSVVYIGPPEIATRIATVAALRMEEAERLPAAAKNRLLARREWSWEELATPRELLTELARDGQLSIVNESEVPHDLWPAVQLPPLSIPERLSIALAGFSRSFEFEADGGAIRLTTWPETAVVVRTHSAGRNPVARVATEIPARFPDVRIRRTGNSFEVSGSYESQIAIERWLRGDRTPVGGETRYNLKIENQPVGGVIQALAKRLGYRVETDTTIQDRLQRLVSFQVENATPDEIMQRATQGTGIRVQRDGDIVKLSAEP